MTDQSTTTEVTERDHAAEIMLDHARDVDTDDIYEHLTEAGVPGAALRVEAIAELIATADIDISWPAGGMTEQPIAAIAAITAERDAARRGLNELHTEAARLRCHVTDLESCADTYMRERDVARAASRELGDALRTARAELEQARRHG